jgi:hypothetical protein
MHPNNMFAVAYLVWLWKSRLLLVAKRRIGDSKDFAGD